MIKRSPFALFVARVPLFILAVSRLLSDFELVKKNNNFHGKKENFFCALT
jgi:hypothetical protein